MAECVEGGGIGPRHGAEDADAGVDHERCGGHAGHQRELGVPLLDWQRTHPLDVVGAVCVPDDLFVGQVEARATAQAFLLDPQRSDLGKEGGQPVFCAIERLLRRDVVELSARADQSTLQTEVGDRPLGIQRERPHERRPVDIGEE
jgi:hypothetical protein